MQRFTSVEELSALTDNKIIGAEGLTMNNSEIRFGGEGNILFVEDGVRLDGSKINFACSNSVIYLSSNRSLYKLNLTVNNDCTFFIGKNNYINGTLNVTVSEQKHVFIGDEGLFAFGIWVRTADPHLVYSAVDKKRINHSKSVFLGDHVWTGQNVIVLKGTRVHSGSIIGAGAVCTGKTFASNTSCGGNPAKMIAQDIFWDGKCVHSWQEEQTEENERYGSDRYIFSFNEKEYISFDEIDKKLSSLNAEDKLEYLKKLSDEKTKNRFASGKEAQKRGLFHNKQRV